MRMLAVALAATAVAGCATVSPRDRELARAHLALAEQSFAAGDPRGALAEIETAVQHDPENPQVRNLYGLLYHVAFRQNERAIAQYRKAIELSPDYTEAKVNLSAVLMDEGAAPRRSLCSRRRRRICSTGSPTSSTTTWAGARSSSGRRRRGSGTCRTPSRSTAAFAWDTATSAR